MWYSVMKKVELGWSWRTHVLLAWLEKTQARHKSSSLRWWLCDDLGCNFCQREITVGDSRRKSNSWIIHIRTLNDFLLPLIPEGRRGTIVYQQDNATIHKAHLTKMWLLYQNIKTIDWPAHSPDLNPIENVWGLLARRVYANGRVFSTIDELRSCILTEWQNLETETIQNLITSMPSDVFQSWIIKVIVFDQQVVVSVFWSGGGR